VTRLRWRVSYAKASRGLTIRMTVALCAQRLFCRLHDSQPVLSVLGIQHNPIPTDDERCTSSWINGGGPPVALGSLWIA